MSQTPFQDAQRAAKTWIATDLCAPRGWTAPPTGVPLCRMRLTPAQHGSLGGVLRLHLRRYWPTPPQLAALFCLFAVEVLRARPGGETWSWSMVARALPSGPRPDDDKMRELVEPGLAFWRRPLRHGPAGSRRFLYSLVLEAGIPHALLARQEFSDFLRHTQRALDLYGAPTVEAVLAHATDQAHRLPQVWRQPDTLALAAELLHAVQPLRAGPGAGPGAAPPGWRDALPLDLTDAAAERLIQGLLRQERARTKPLGELHTLCARLLVHGPTGWDQRLAAEGPGWLPRPVVARPPFSLKEHPHRVRFAVDGAEVGLAEFEAEGRWRFRPLPGAASRLPFEDAATARLLVDGHERERLPLPGGEALDGGPWVFESLPDAAHACAGEPVPDTLRLVGQGSRSSGGARLFVALDPAQGVLDVRAGTAEPCGAVPGTPRVVFEIAGEALWREPGLGLVVRLRTGGAAGGGPRMVVTAAAPRWAVLHGAASLGPPAVAVPGHRPGWKLLWRPHGRGAAEWMPLPRALPVGAAEVVLVDGQEMLDRRRLLVLPAASTVTARADSGGVEVRVRGLGEVAAALPEYPDAAVERTADGTVLRARSPGLPPASVLLATRLPGGAEVLHRVGVPLSAGGFLGAHGRALPANHVATFADIAGLVARAGEGDDRAELAVRLAATAGRLDGVRLGRVLGFVDELPLARLRPELLKLFATAELRDAELRLNVLRAGLDGPGLRVSAFDAVPWFNPAAPRARLQDRSGRWAPADGAHLAALALARPGEAPVVLAADATGGWHLPQDPPGPWLVIGAGPLTGRVRPSVWPGVAQTAETQTAGRLAAAAAVPWLSERGPAFHAALSALAEAPRADDAAADWAFLDATLDAAGRHAPAIFFDVLARAAEVPDVLVQWLLRTDAAGLARLAALEDELPLAWALVPLASWTRATEAAAAYYGGLGIPAGLVLAPRLDDIAALCPPAVAGVWAARDAVGLAHGRNQPCRAQLAALSGIFALHAGRDPGETEWNTALAAATNWGNLPSIVHDGAPHVAARHTTGGPALSPRAVSAVRFCRHAAPDEFDTRFINAVFLRLARAPAACLDP